VCTSTLPSGERGLPITHGDGSGACRLAFVPSVATHTGPSPVSRLRPVEVHATGRPVTIGVVVSRGSVASRASPPRIRRARTNPPPIGTSSPSNEAEAPGASTRVAQGAMGPVSCAGSAMRSFASKRITEASVRISRDPSWWNARGLHEEPWAFTAGPNGR
jgi:hypothetical protein